MKDILSKELILKVSGEVLDSNIKEFEAYILTGISNIKTELVTDQDFAEAKEAVKSCKTLETWLKNALDEAVMSMKTVAEVRQIADRLMIKLRNTRLDLNTKVKTEEAARKQEIIEEGIANVHEALKDSPVKHAISVNSVAINDAIKNKRSLQKMKEAVVDAVFDQVEAIVLLERLFLSNSKLIQDTEKEYPGLFPDIKTIALSPVEVVESQIESRVNKFKYDLKIKQDADRIRKEEYDRRVEELRVRVKLEAERKAKEKDDLEVEGLRRPTPKEQEVMPPSFDEPATSPSFDEPEEKPGPPREITLIIRVLADKKQSVAQALDEIDGIVWVSEGE